MADFGTVSTWPGMVMYDAYDRIESSSTKRMRNRHLFLLDLILLAPLPFLAMALRMETFAWQPEYDQAVFAYAAVALVVRLGVAYSAGLYRFLWRHASLVELERLVFAAVTAAALVSSRSVSLQTF